MKDNKKEEKLLVDAKETKGIKEIKEIKDEKSKRQSIPLSKNSIFVKNPKSSISQNYFNNVKQNKSKNPPLRHSFMMDQDKKTQISMKQEKISLNKTMDLNSLKNTNKNANNQNKINKKNSLYLNTKKENNNNNQKNNVVRKSMILMNKNNDNKLNKFQDKRGSLILQKNKNSIRINKDKSNTILEEILEKNENKKNIDNNENNQENKNKKDYKRAYSRKLTERDRQKKLNKLNKKSFGAVEKYTKKTAQFLKRDRKDINKKNNIINGIKPKNKIQRTKTNYSLITENRLMNNAIKNNNKFGVVDWSNRNLPEMKKNVKKPIHTKTISNLYDKYYKKENNNLQKDKNNRLENRKNNQLFQTLPFKNILNHKSGIKPKNKNANIKKKFEINNKNKYINRPGSVILPSKGITRGKSAVSLRNQKPKITKKLAKISDKPKKLNINIKNKKLNKSFIKTENKEKEKEKEKKEKKIKKEKKKESSDEDSSDSDKKVINLNKKKVEDESSEEDDEDEDDFDIYKMIRSKSCNKKSKKESQTMDNSDENSEESEEKSFDSEEECDIEGILYGKESKKVLKNIDDESIYDTNSVVRYIDFDEVFLTSNNMFTENILKNNLYNKYNSKFEQIFAKFVLKVKENKILINEKKEKIKKESKMIIIDSINEKDNQILNQSELTKDDDSQNKNTNS